MRKKIVQQVSKWRWNGSFFHRVASEFKLSIFRSAPRAFLPRGNDTIFQNLDRSLDKWNDIELLTSRWSSGTTTSPHIVVGRQVSIQWVWWSLTNTWLLSHFLKHAGECIHVNNRVHIMLSSDDRRIRAQRRDRPRIYRGTARSGNFWITSILTLLCDYTCTLDVCM